MTEVQQQPKLDGWKTKWGGILMAIGSAIGGASRVAPNPELAQWLVFIGVLVGGFGTALLGVGIGHKVQKSAAAKIILVALLIAGMTSAPAWALNWHTANQATVAWDAITADIDGDPIPAGFEVRYKVYLVNAATDPGKANPAEISTAGGILETQLTFTLAAKGKYYVGVRAYQVDSTTGEEVAESAFAWSDNPTDCADVDGDGTGDDFGIRYYVALAAPGGMRPVESP